MLGILGGLPRNLARHDNGPMLNEARVGRSRVGAGRDG